MRLSSAAAVRLMPAAFVVAIPAMALGGLLGLATTQRSHVDQAACADWVREYRDARDGLSLALRQWREPPPDTPRPPRPDDVRQRVADLAAVRPPGCTLDGRRPG